MPTELESQSPKELCLRVRQKQWNFQQQCFLLLKSEIHTRPCTTSILMSMNFLSKQSSKDNLSSSTRTSQNDNKLGIPKTQSIKSMPFSHALHFCMGPILAKCVNEAAHQIQIITSCKSAKLSLFPNANLPKQREGHMPTNIHKPKNTQISFSLQTVALVDPSSCSCPSTCSSPKIKANHTLKER